MHYCQRRITKLVASGEGGGGEGEMVEEMTVKEITFWERNCSGKVISYPFCVDTNFGRGEEGEGG